MANVRGPNYPADSRRRPRAAKLFICDLSVTLVRLHPIHQCRRRPVAEANRPRQSARKLFQEGPVSDGMMVSRLYTDSSGDSRFDQYEVSLTLQPHAPPAVPFLTADAEPARNYIFFRIPPGWVGARHTTPDNRLVICLAGALQFTGSTGESLTLQPGDRMLDVNTSGKGHETAVVSTTPAEGLIVRVP